MGHDTVAHMEAVDPGGLAGRWFGVRAEYVRPPVLIRIRQSISWFFGGVLTLGLTMGDYDPKRSCSVIVLRRDTGGEVARFSYESLGDATGHVASLRSRLEATHVFDFCRELGIPTAAVAGAGSEEPSSVEWLEISELRPR